jgi:hypothetical protein
MDYWYAVRFLGSQLTIAAIAWVVMRLWRVL